MPAVENSMQHTAIARRPSRSQQQDAKAWSAFTGCTYTAALRQMMSPLAQGILGPRVSARHLTATLKNHELIGIENKHSVAPLYSANGVRRSDYAETWRFNGTTDYVELAMVAEFLRMFGTVSELDDPDSGVHSYSLKHTAENFLAPHLDYVSNGQIIWAAAALGVPLVDQEDHEGPNVHIGIDLLEHRYVRDMVARMDDGLRPKAHHYRPAGYEFLRTGLHRAAAGEIMTEKWIEPEADTAPKPFHEWMVVRASDDTVVGDISADYCAGVSDSDHGMAAHPEDFLEIFRHVGASPGIYDSAYEAVRDYYLSHKDTSPVRTVRAARSMFDDDYAATYVCPCGYGYVEEYDGERMHIDCYRCSTQWYFSPSNHVDSWGLLPAGVTAS